jgi:hypothetical protein
MKFKTFDNMMTEIQEYLESLDRKEKLLESLYGTCGDNPLASEYLFVEKMIDVALKDLKADDWVYDSIWSLLTETYPEDLLIDNAQYECTLENIWMYCKGKLDERYSIGFMEEDDPIVFYGADAEKELLSMLEEEIAQEINNEVQEQQESYINQTLSAIFLDINAIKEEYLFEKDNEKIRMQIKGDIFQLLLQDYISTKKIYDFKIDFDIFEDKNVILVSIQIWPATEGYTLKVIL